ncbi:MAG: CotH kinase family protein [Bacteroidaceae bacterium]|nr:CotH kinase family protein [Bacteroidaceae bacterium]
MKKILLTLTALVIAIATQAQQTEDMYIYFNNGGVDKIEIADVDSITFVAPTMQTAEDTGLPRVYITTPGGVGINSKDVYVEDGTLSIFDKNGGLELNILSDFKGRGNSTWQMPKKPYAIKLSSKAEVMGMPKHKRWVLLANWVDRTLLRNDIAFEIAKKCPALPWTPRGEFVELYLNGKHRGNYYLCEHIKIDKNRVNIDEIDEETPETDLSGGYLLEFDTYSNAEINYFYTKHKNLPVTIKEPDEEVITSWEHPAYTYIQDYVNSVEEALKKGDYSEIETLIDVESYAEWWLLYNLVGNLEPNHPKSCYMYKKRNGKLYAGPAWDFDCATFIPGRKGALLTQVLWYGYLFKHDAFKSLVKERWTVLKPEFEKVFTYIDEKAEYIRESNEINLEMWPVTQNVNEDIDLSYDDAVNRMKEAYRERITELDVLITNY